MADRWSNPSNSRFRVWPSGTDSYDHEELADNWDALDAIIGIPGTGTWPTTLGVGAGIYGEIQTAKNSAIPVGAMFNWFRPVASMEYPEGCVPCIGQTLDASEHDIPDVSGDFAVPDMRNRFVIGADPSSAIGLGAVEVGDSDINAAAGAPGAQSLGGTNLAPIDVSQMPSHNHTGSVTGWGPDQETWYDDNGGRFPKAGNWEVYRHDAGNSIGTGGGGYASGQHAHALSDLASEGDNKPHDNMPRYVGLIWLIKVKDPT